MLAAMVLAVTVGATADAAPVSPQGVALAAAVRASLDEVRARQAKLPPPSNDAERIVRLGELDQAPRAVVTRFDWSSIPATDRDAAFRAEGAIMDASDHEVLSQLLHMLPPEGWFPKSRYGGPAAHAAFLIVQHADLDTKRRILPKLEAMAGVGEAEGEDAAGMSDKLAVSEGRPQRYGSQFRCDGGKWRPYPLEDEANVEAFRSMMGMHITFAQIKAFFAAQPPCPQTPSPPPAGMKLD